MKRCEINDCLRPYYGKGFCNLHWRKNHQHGDPLFSTDRRGHLPIPPEIRFWPKVDKDGPIPDYAPHLGPCWIWTAGISSVGYGVFSPGQSKQTGAHRFSYQLLVGPAEKGMHIDHLCRVTRCVNPTHLELVTPAINTQRGNTGKATKARHASQTHCKQGHVFDAANTRISTLGSRVCVACSRVASRESQRRRRAAGKR